jgi:hypothetical protein
MLIHAMILWPDIITEQLWPYAFCLAVDLHNTTPGPSGLTPEEFVIISLIFIHVVVPSLC